MSKRNLARARVTAVLKRKKRPRGRAFAKGNTLGNRFPPGVSGNPGGRPSSKEIGRASRAWLAEKVTKEELRAHRLPLELDGLTHAEVLVVIRGQYALGGSLSDQQELTDRAEGRPATSLSITERANPLDALIAGMSRLSERLGKPEKPPGFGEDAEESPVQ